MKDMQMYYWAHMLDECGLNEIDFSDIDRKPGMDSQKAPLKAALKVLGDDTYDEFVDDLNKLMAADADGKIKRLKDALVKQFNSGNVKISYNDNETVEVSKFKATQNEVCISNSLVWALQKGDPAQQAEKLFPADGVVKLGPPICAAAIGDQYYVIDGHHRWSQAACFNPGAKIAAYVIRSDSFKVPDDILKFVQMEIFVHTADKMDELPKAKGSGSDDNNLFKASDGQIEKACIGYMDSSRDERGEDSCSAKFLCPKMGGAAGGYEEMRDFVAKAVIGNVHELKKFGQYPDQHDREIMPQTGTDKTGVENDHKGILGPGKADNTQPLNLKECLSRGFYLDEIGESLRSAGVAGKRVAESHPPLEDFLGKDGTYGRNFRDILKNVFHRYGEGYSADAFVAFSKEMAKRDPELAKRLRRFLGQFASGKFDGDDGYDRWGDDQGKCSSIASALQGMLAAALQS